MLYGHGVPFHELLKKNLPRMQELIINNNKIKAIAVRKENKLVKTNARF